MITLHLIDVKVVELDLDAVIEVTLEDVATMHLWRVWVRVVGTAEVARTLCLGVVEEESVIPAFVSVTACKQFILTLSISGDVSGRFRSLSRRPSMYLNHLVVYLTELLKLIPVTTVVQRRAVGIINEQEHEWYMKTAFLSDNNLPYAVPYKLQTIYQVVVSL